MYPHNANFTVRDSKKTMNSLITCDNKDASIKGISILWELHKTYDFFLSTVIDPMHCVSEGVMKQCIRRWVDKSASEELGSVRGKNLHKLLDTLLENIKLPSEYKRNVRPYQAHGHYWKGKLQI